MAAKKLLMIVGDFVEDYEAMVPFQILTMVGHNVHTICPGKKAGDTVKTAVHDFIGDQTYAEFQGHRFLINKTYDEVNPQDYDALVIPGGRAPEYLRLDSSVIEIVKHYVDTKKPIAAICHGLQLLAPIADSIKGTDVLPYPAVGPDCKVAGANVISPNDTFSNAVTCNNYVTAPAWPAHPEWMKQFLKMLGSVIEP